ncbi:MAG: FMN-binding negative transcriptional regulator [Rhodospirillales bacterium]
MYIPRHFASDDIDLARDIVRDHAFALLMTSPQATQDAPDISHLPMLWLADDAGYGRMIGHVARANNHWQRFDGSTTSLAIFSGPHAYISPNYYASQAMVPTWNYAAVHLYGKPVAVADDAGATGILDTLVSAFENDTTGNWSTARLPDGHLERQLKGIVAFEMPVQHIDIKLKMSQNRGAADVAGVISALSESAYHDDRDTAAMMQALNKSTLNS